MNDWNFDPLELSVLAFAAALYWRRARTLARRGRPVPRPRLAAFAAGLLALFVALASPIDTIGEERAVIADPLQQLLGAVRTPLPASLGDIEEPRLREHVRTI